MYFEKIAMTKTIKKLIKLVLKNFSFLLILLALFSTSIHFLTLLSVGANVDHGAVLCGYLGLALMGATYAAIGTYASSVTENQVVSFIIGVFIVLVFFMLDKNFLPFFELINSSPNL